MKKFDLRKMIAENKATFFSSLSEGYMGQFYAPEYLEQKYGKEKAKEIEAEIQDMDENSWDRFLEMMDAEEVENYIADIKDMLDISEGKAAYEYEKGKEAGEAIEKKKMKKSELKAKIKEMIVAEMDGPAVEDEEYDFLKEMENMLEADEEADAEEAPAEEPTGDEAVDTTVDVSTDEVDPNVKAVQDALTQAQAAAQQLGDKKLMDQIGNTITFFTRAHVVEKPKGAIAEEIKEGYYSTTNIESYIDAIGYESFEDFFNDNPGGESVLINWIESVPEFRQSLKGADLLEGKKEDLNESMFPILKKIIK